MILKAIIEDQVYTLSVPDPVIAGGAAVFDRLDADMDQGWQMSRDWVAAPNRLQRAQIVADKLLTALEKGNERLGMMMAGYILARLPGVAEVEPDLSGEMQNTVFRFHDQAGDQPSVQTAALPAEETTAAATPAAPAGLSKLAAMAQAGQDVTKVFKVGKAWRFSVFDQATGTWQDGPLIATEAEAERLRQLAFKGRYEALLRGDRTAG